jgi:hypothetical protein
MTGSSLCLAAPLSGVSVQSIELITSAGDGIQIEQPAAMAG